MTAFPPPGVVGVAGVSAARCIFSREEAIESSAILSPYALPVPSDLGGVVAAVVVVMLLAVVVVVVAMLGYHPVPPPGATTPPSTQPTHLVSNPWSAVSRVSSPRSAPPPGVKPPPELTLVGW